MILAQKLRLVWIDACLDQDMGLNRADIAMAFEMSIPQASHDLREYISRWPDRIRYDRGRKAYYRAWAEPAFGHETRRAVLMALHAMRVADI